MLCRCRRWTNSPGSTRCCCITVLASHAGLPDQAQGKAEAAEAHVAGATEPLVGGVERAGVVVPVLPFGLDAGEGVAAVAIGDDVVVAEGQLELAHHHVLQDEVLP